MAVLTENDGFIDSEVLQRFLESKAEEKAIVALHVEDNLRIFEEVKVVLPPWWKGGSREAPFRIALLRTLSLFPAPFLFRGRRGTPPDILYLSSSKASIQK